MTKSALADYQHIALERIRYLPPSLQTEVKKAALSITQEELDAAVKAHFSMLKDMREEWQIEDISAEEEYMKLVARRCSLKEKLVKELSALPHVGARRANHLVWISSDTLRDWEEMCHTVINEPEKYLKKTSVVSLINRIDKLRQGIPTSKTQTRYLYNRQSLAEVRRYVYSFYPEK